MSMPRRITLLTTSLLSLTLVACDDDDPGAPTAERWLATLNGANEVPPVTTAGSGVATFEAVGDTAINYTITAANLTGVTMGHLHTGPAGANGGVLVWLLPPNGTAPQEPSGQVSGTIASGRITQAWIRGVGGQPAISLDSLKQLLRNRAAYVNIHTSANAGGEIRGQVQPN